MTARGGGPLVPGGPPRACAARLGPGRAGIETLELESDVVALTVLVGKGADVYALTHKPTGVDVLLKTEWGLRDPRHEPAVASEMVRWTSLYAGGWQELVPNGGSACVHDGIDYPFHGEAAVAPWNCTIVEEGGGAAEALLAVRLLLTPLRLERRMRVEAGSGVVVIRERLTNEGTRAISYMWGHHPAFGAPFLAPGARVTVGARQFLAAEEYVGTCNPLVPGRSYRWPFADGTDVSEVPARGVRRDFVAYLTDWTATFFAIANLELGVGFGLTWSESNFPYAWLWQELGASEGFPWFGRGYATAIEPNTSYPAVGIAAVAQSTRTERRLAPGESAEVELRAVVFPARSPVARIETDGTATLEERE